MLGGHHTTQRKLNNQHNRDLRHCRRSMLASQQALVGEAMGLPHLLTNILRGLSEHLCQDNYVQYSTASPGSTQDRF